MIVWLFISSIIVIIIVITLLYSYKNIPINPEIIPIDRYILQLRESNNILYQTIQDKILTINNLNTKILNLTNEKNTLTILLNQYINEITTQVVIPPNPPDPDPELVLLVDTRTLILQYMDANIVLGTTYLKTSVFYVFIDSIIDNYLSTSELSLIEFNAKYTEPRTLLFRQTIEQIYNNTLPYNFDSFYTNLSNP